MTKTKPYCQTSRKKAYTLVEVLVVIGILGLVFSAVAIMFVNVNQVQVKNNTLTLLKQQGNYVVDFVWRKVRSAETIAVVSTNEATITYYNDSDTYSLICDETSDNFQYGLEDNEEPLTPAGTDIVLSGCSFAVDNMADPPTLTLQFTLTLNSMSESFYKKVSLRNY